MQRGLPRPQHLEHPVAALGDDAVRLQSFQCVVEIEVGGDAEGLGEFSLDGLVDGLEIADVDRPLGEHAVEQQLLLDVLLRSRIGE